MTKKELINDLAELDDDDVIVCMDLEGCRDNIERVDIRCKAIVFGGGSPFSDE